MSTIDKSDEEIWERILELKAANDLAKTWGAAVDERQEEIDRLTVILEVRGVI